MKVFTNLLFFLLFIVLNFDCHTDGNKIPYVYVDFMIDMDLPEFFELNTIGNYVYVTGGVSGIIIYRDSRDVFYAYERACPYDPECGRVSVIDGEDKMIDSCCGSEYSLSLEGAVLKGPSNSPLLRYQTIYYPATNQLRVFNQ